MAAQSFTYDVLKLILKAECERLKRFPLPGRRLSVAAYVLPRALEDAQIAQLVDIVAPSLRGYDVVAAADGQVLLLFHPETTPENATRVAVRVRDLLADALASFGQNANYMKIAVVSYPPFERRPEEILPTLLQAAGSSRPGTVLIVEPPTGVAARS